MSRTQPLFWLTPKGMAAAGLIAAASYFLLMEHRQHLVAWLPYLILALCPLMHLFMHGAHGHGGRHGQDSDHRAEEAAFRRGVEEGLKRAENRPREED